MGMGAYSAASYSATRATRQATGTSAFQHTVNVQQGKVQAGAHDDLKVLDANGDLVRRESRDSDDHPVSTPIAVIFDETASMGVVPEILVDKLDTLHGLITGGGYAEGPQILFGAVGDGKNLERAPIQIGQFEADNTMDAVLGNIYLENNGGGNNGESYGYPLYFFSHQVDTDHWEKRGEKGYLFICGDEPFHGVITPAEAKRYLGLSIETDLDVREIITQCLERWHVFYLHMTGTQWHRDPSLKAQVTKQWTEVLGEDFIPDVEPETAAETIASLIGLREGVVDLDGALDNLDSVGSSKLKGNVGNSLATVGSNAVGKVATASTPAVVGDAFSSGTDRL